MALTRRTFIERSGRAALGSTLLPAFSAMAFAQSTPNQFDINAAFAAFMKDIGGTPADAGGNAVFVGSDLRQWL